jgi:hypothetical protein
MTAEITANCIAALSLVVAVASVAVTGLALRRRNEAQKRGREAIIVVRKVWEATPAIDLRKLVIVPVEPYDEVDLNPRLVLRAASA